MRRLSGWDAYLLYAETPQVNTHTLKVAILDPATEDGPMTFERFRGELEAYLPRLEPFRFQLLEVPLGLHHPMWLEDAAVDLDHHLFRHELPSPGGRRELDGVIGEIAGTQLDRRRPLWTLHYVEGLAHGRIAIVAKIHHALADGMASANLLAKLLTPGPGRLPERAARPVGRPPTRRELLRHAASDHLRTLRHLPPLLVHTARAVRRVRATKDRYLPDEVRMLDAPTTFLNQPLSPRRSFGTATVSLPAVRELGARADVTINDVALTAVSSAVRQLFLQRGDPTPPIVASVPVSTNRDPERIHGNHLAGFFLTLPIDEDDPRRRLDRVQRSARAGKRRFDLLGADLYDRWVEYLPPRPSAAVFRLLSSGRLTTHNTLFNIPVSNVPGPSFQGYLAGMPVIELYSIGPVMDRSAVNVTIWSYHGRLEIAVITDAAVLPDAGYVADLVRDGFRELLACFSIPERPATAWDEPPGNETETL